MPTSVGALTFVVVIVGLLETLGGGLRTHPGTRFSTPCASRAVVNPCLEFHSAGRVLP